MDGNEQDPRHLHRSGSCLRHRAWAPRLWPNLGLSAVAVPLPMLLCLAVLSRSGPAERGARLPVHGTPEHLLGGSAALAIPYYAGGFEIYVPVLYQRLLLCYTVLYGSCAFPVLQNYIFTHRFQILNIPRVGFNYCTVDWILNCLPPLLNNQDLINN